jgi:hypothetical protein
MSIIDEGQAPMQRVGLGFGGHIVEGGRAAIGRLRSGGRPAPRFAMAAVWRNVR